MISLGATKKNHFFLWIDCFFFFGFLFVSLAKQFVSSLQRHINTFISMPLVSLFFVVFLRLVFKMSQTQKPCFFMFAPRSALSTCFFAQWPSRIFLALFSIFQELRKNLKRHRKKKFTSNLGEIFHLMSVKTACFRHSTTSKHLHARLHATQSSKAQCMRFISRVFFLTTTNNF